MKRELTQRDAASVTPRTMTAEHEKSIRVRSSFPGNLDNQALIEELDAERAAHAEIIKATDALRDSIGYVKSALFGGPITIKDALKIVDAALAQYKAARDMLASSKEDRDQAVPSSGRRD